ncbi:MAG: LuxR C-terminal-related transcriptional regulator [Serratia sp. (in: enterobacteria)]|uniref:LuxR C-terminal-related transcriptional regulator n=1 Tax=Serratia sp. (in: enterobacteria) TaxID=616 RepID=UPI003F2B9EFB
MIDEISKIVNKNKTLTSSMKVPWALVMDTCPMTRGGVNSLLKTSQLHTGEVIMLNKASDILLCLKVGMPDLIVMELCGEGESVLEGLRIIRLCHHSWPFIPLVVCTALTDVRFLQQVKSLRVSSICHKNDPLESIEGCIKHASLGLYQDSPTIQGLLSCEHGSHHLLTKKEIDVLVHLLGGCSVSDVSRMLNRDIRTISSHKCSALTKLGYKNNRELYTRGHWMQRDGLYNLQDAKQL